MADLERRYRKLPGRRRGAMLSASLWMGDDHVLSAKSNRFHEHYKRFYFRDIQAIVVTKAPRFYLSTPALGMGILCAIAILTARFSAPRLATGLELAFAGLVGFWIYLSAASSCICHLYTAVSREELPSIYRMRTAHAVLAELEPRISEVQGTVPEDWAEAEDERPLGPPRANPAEGEYIRRPAPKSRTWVSEVFLASLLADAITTTFAARFPGRFIEFLIGGLALIQVATAIWILVQHNRGVLRAGIQRVAIAALVFLGAMLYGQNIATVFVTARAGAQGARISSKAMPIQAQPPKAFREVYAAGCVLLFALGVLVSLESNEPKQPGLIGE